MWQRLKNSLIALTFSALTVVTVTQVGEPAHQVGVLAPADLLQASALRQLDPETRMAVQIAASLAAVALDEALRESNRAMAEVRTASPERRATPSRNLKMPFYSFAARSLRSGKEI